MRRLALLALTGCIAVPLAIHDANDSLNAAAYEKQRAAETRLDDDREAAHGVLGALVGDAGGDQ